MPDFFVPAFDLLSASHASVLFFHPLFLPHLSIFSSHASISCLILTCAFLPQNAVELCLPFPSSPCSDMRACFLFIAQPFNSRCLLFECVSVILLAAVFWLCCLGSASPLPFHNLQSRLATQTHPLRSHPHQLKIICSMTVRIPDYFIMSASADSPT